MNRIKRAWMNAYYRITLTYIAIVVTLIFAFQIYEYCKKTAVPCNCGAARPVLSLIPVIGAFIHV